MAKPRTYTVDAVVLRHTDFGEADRLVVLYARGRGKLRALAKGVRRIRSRKAGHLEPFTETRLMLAQGRDLDVITQAQALQTFPQLRGDLTRFTYAAYAAELADKFTFEGEDHPGLYSLLVHTLQRLANYPDLDLVTRYYELHLLEAAGFRPELGVCTICGTVIRPETQYFDPHHGGVICPKCAAKAPGSRPISLPALKYLRYFQRSSFREATRARPIAPVHREMEALMHDFLTHVLERRLNAPVFLQHLRRMENGLPPATEADGSKIS